MRGVVMLDATPAGVMLDVKISTKRYSPAKDVLRDVVLTAVAGEVIAILGPSGIGKSTILRIVIGLDRSFDGDVRRHPGRIGVMFQEPRLPPWLTVEDNLRLVQPGVNVAALLRTVMLPDTANLLPSSLSLGMARRVALARALAVDPSVLVLDEPFASLDQNLAAGLGRVLVDRARQHGTLILMASHDIDQTLAAATRILVLGGNPATLEADFAVPPVSDRDSLRDFRRDLLDRFEFLGNPDMVDTQ